MTNDINGNVIIAEVVKTLIKDCFYSISSNANKFMSDTWSKFFEEFEPYMTKTYLKNNYIRILSQTDKNIEFSKVYIGSYFECSGDRMSDDEVIEHLYKGKNIIINGNGGAGKTFFMRYLWTKLFENSFHYSPIFLELRDLNSITSSNLNAFIRKSISPKKDLSTDIFNYFCNQGRFCFILDGFDEVSHEKREALQKEIIDLSSEYPDCRFVLSSRDNQIFSGWSNFDIFRSSPFTFEQVKQLVDQLPFEVNSKKLFKKKLTQKFYNEYESFLSNPLLSVMMMMTFKNNMDIPKRMSVFYQQAFYTLYKLHDATKIYSRSKWLEIDLFQRSFSMFCLYSYFKEKYIFSEVEILDYISNSNNFCKITTKPVNILSDYVESVNLIKQDGFNYEFIHRSFQEYFCAYALTNIVSDKFSDYFEHISNRVEDTVLLMCYELNPNLVIEGYIKKNINLIQNINDEGSYNYLTHYGVEFHVFYDEKNAISVKVKNEKSVDFITNVNTVINFQKNTMYIFDKMFSSEEGFVIPSLIELKSSKITHKLIVKFHNNEVMTEISLLDDDSMNHEEKKILNSRYKTKLNSIDFNKLDKILEFETKKIEKWCNKEVSSLNKREKNLEQLLGF